MRPRQRSRGVEPAAEPAHDHAAGPDRDRARTLARNGDYAGAIATLTPLHGRRDLDPKLQQDILLTLGEMHASPLNVQRDDAKARLYLEELLRDHPDSEHADRARKLLDEVSR